MDREVLVYVDLAGAPNRVGRLWSHVRKGRETASFEYDREWLANPARFSLEPALMLGPGPFHTNTDTPSFGAIGDSAPDRWGRALMRRAERRRATQEKRAPRTLQEVDFLLQVDDEVRQGALRFAVLEGGPFLREPGPLRTPPVVELPALLAASDRVVEDRETDDDLRLLLAPGSSLGGARPKAAVRDRDGHLAIAKFRRHDDEYDIVRWEAVTHDLAAQAGIRVPETRVEAVAGTRADCAPL
jgi:serine/threonine-protein kinase HipA